MTWVKLDDQFHWHPKIASLSSEAYRLFVGGLCVCNTHRTGGVIWTSRFSMAAEGVKGPKRALTELLQAGLWREIEVGWEIHDYGTYQPTSDAQREAASRAGRRSGEARRERTVNGALNETGTEDEPSVERSVEPSVERNANGIERATQARGSAGGNPVSRLPFPVTQSPPTSDSVPPNPPNGPIQPYDPEVLARAGRLRDAVEDPASGIWGRPVTARDWPMLLEWGELRRDGAFVPLPEILECARRQMATMTPNGTPPGSLKWAHGSVVALGRMPLATQSTRAEQLAAAESEVRRRLGIDGADPPMLRALPGGAV